MKIVCPGNRKKSDNTITNIQAFGLNDEILVGISRIFVFIWHLKFVLNETLRKNRNANFKESL